MLQTLLSPGALQSPPRGEVASESHVAPHPPKSMPPEVSVHAESAPLSPRRQGAARTPCVGSWWEVARWLWGQGWGSICSFGGSRAAAVRSDPLGQMGHTGQAGELRRGEEPGPEGGRRRWAGASWRSGHRAGRRTCGRAGLVTGEASACLQAPGPVLAGCSGKSWAVEGLGFRGAWRACSPERGFPPACVCECTYVRVHTRVCRMAPRADLHPDGRPAPCSLPGPRPP